VKVLKQSCKIYSFLSTFFNQFNNGGVMKDGTIDDKEIAQIGDKMGVKQ